MLMEMPADDARQAVQYVFDFLATYLSSRISLTCRSGN
jgi:hypothetical protein